MKGINKVIIVGIVGMDPETKGSAVRVSLATSEKWRDKTTGDTQERTEWHKVVFYGKLSEIVNTYVRKGSKLYIEGSIRTSKWQDETGNDRYSTSIIAGTMQMLDSKKESPNGNYNTTPKGNSYTPNIPDYEDDLPF